ncbi:MAG: hypothetical protein GXP53_06745 [Deltaproteobacteria bacterium]|nr:hypothetical protein [Deltaproteobacteria bacterium]
MTTTPLRHYTANIFLPLLVLFLLLLPSGCSTTGDVVRVITVSNDHFSGINEEDLAQLEEIKKSRENKKKDLGLETVISGTPNYSVTEYLKLFPHANDSTTRDYRVGGYDTLDITVYEEPDISRKNVRISAAGYISFPFIGRIKVKNLTTLEIEKLISAKLAKGQYLLDASVSVTVNEFKSKTFMVLGSVKTPGSFSLKAQDRVLDAISKAGGLLPDSSNQGIIIRTLNPNTPKESKLVIWIDIAGLLNEGNQASNLLLADKDLLYIPKTEHIYIIGQVQHPGSYPYRGKKTTLIEAISMAGGFTPIAAPNKTRIIRVENGKNKIIEVKVNAITKSGKKGQDVLILPGDVIVVPESLF